MEKRLIPEIRFKRFEGNWEEEKLNQIVNRVTRKNADLSSDLPLTISAQDGLIAQNKYYGRQIASKNISGYYKILKGEFAYNKSYSNGYPYGAIKRLEKHDDGVLSTLYILFKVKTGDSNFVKYYFESDFWHRSIVKISAEGARNHGLLNIPVNDFFKIYVKTPNIDEQEKIGRLFESLDQTIDLQGKVLEENKRLKKVLLQKLFPKKGQKLPELRLKGFSGDWEDVAIGDIFKVTRGNVLAKNFIRDEKDSEYRYPVYSSQTLNNGLLGYYNDYLYENAITWTTDGANAGTVNYREGKFYSTNVNGVLLSNEGYSNRMIAERLNGVAYRYVSRVGNPKLMNNVMSKIIISIPSISEQEAIGHLFKALDEKIAREEERLEGYKTLKKSLLQKMFV